MRVPRVALHAWARVLANGKSARPNRALPIQKRVQTRSHSERASESRSHTPRATRMLATMAAFQ